MEKIDLKQILVKHSKAHASVFQIYPDYDTSRVLLSGDEAIAAMQEVWNTCVIECKKAAITKCLNAPETTCFECEYHIIDKNSIEQVKQMIL